MSYARRPSLQDRAMSFPQSLRISMPAPRDHSDQVTTYRHNVMTPPASPASSRRFRSSKDLSNSPESLAKEIRPTSMLQTSKAPRHSRADDDDLFCPYDVDVLLDHRGRKQTYGSGAWSTVYKGTCRPRQMQTLGLLTPPTSPTPQTFSPPVLVAIKTPARRDATPILRNEALILNHLMSEHDHAKYVVPFYGILPSDSSLVLEAIPQSLEDHIKKCAVSARMSRSTINMTQPVIGPQETWLTLAHSLVSALSWLHNEAMVVHGDIKPGNILLYSDQPSESLFPYQPLLTDFSSAQLLNRPEPTLNTLSAVTREYTAPELLSSKVLSDPSSTATTASDVFSLGVTLLVAATGNTMVYSGSVYQRQAMATQGWGIIGMLRSGDDGIRLPRKGAVEHVVERAVLKKDMGRIDAETWRLLVEQLAKTTPSIA